MTFKISGLDKLQKQLRDAQRAFDSLDGTVATLSINPHEPGSVLAAITQMENAIDTKVSPYRGNVLVESLAEQMKATYREKIEEKAAMARSEPREQDTQSAEDLPTALRQIENTVTDLKWAEHNSFGRHIKKLSRLLHSAELEPATAELSAGIDLDAWIAAGEATQGGMVGSAELEWPSDHNQEIGTVILLIDRFATDPDQALNFAHTFYYNGNKYTANLQNMIAQVIVPFARDYIDYVKAKTGVTEATMLPAPKSAPAARKVFVVHGHEDGAREAVARFLERLGFEAIILHEQANQGRTIIEKFEAHSDVGFAVVLLTPDDEGNAKGQPPRPRARQNVILELGYFVGRLGRSRLMALVQGEIEIPSDFQGVVYETFTNGGAWKQALGRELQAAGFEVDWNKIMG